MRPGARLKERIGAQTPLCLFIGALNASSAGNGQRLRLIAHLGFALFDTNRGTPTVKIRPSLRGFLLASAAALSAMRVAYARLACGNGIFASLILIGFSRPTANASAGFLADVSGGARNDVLVR